MLQNMFCLFISQVGLCFALIGTQPNAKRKPRKIPKERIVVKSTINDKAPVHVEDEKCAEEEAKKERNTGKISM